jgi:hypothetical protein
MLTPISIGGKGLFPDCRSRWRKCRQVLFVISEAFFSFLSPASPLASSSFLAKRAARSTDEPFPYR